MNPTRVTHRRFLLPLLMSLVVANVAFPLMGEEQRAVQGLRIEAGELLPQLPQEMHQVDLGPSPQPGSSRVVEGRRIKAQLNAAGFAVQGLAVPKSVRAVAPGVQRTRQEMLDWLRPHLQRSLPKGVTLLRLQGGLPLMLAPEARVGRVALAPLPKRRGAVRSTVTVEIRLEESTTHRIPLVALLDLSAAAARYDLERGGEVTLSVTLGAAAVSMKAIALKSLDVGQVGTFRVRKTGRSLLGRLTATTRAEVVSR